jgi:hypothetical protein
MNEKIKELAEQAMSATFNKFSGVEWSAEEWRNFYDTKFAELIVRDCIDIADEYDGAGSTIVSRIEKHFGVEE